MNARKRPPASPAKRAARLARVTDYRSTTSARAPRFTLSDVAVWATFTAVVAAAILAGCMLLVVIWPTP